MTSRKKNNISFFYFRILIFSVISQIFFLAGGAQHRISESSADNIKTKLETMQTRPKKLIKSRKVRHASSGGSSGELHMPKKQWKSSSASQHHRSFKFRKNNASRLRTKSESASAEDNFERTPHKSNPGLTKQDATEIKSEDENEEENYDEFDVLTDIHTDSR